MSPKAQSTPALSKPRHPSYEKMIQEAMDDIGHGGGASRQAIKRWIVENYPELAESSRFEGSLRGALRSVVQKGSLYQPRGAAGKIRKASKSSPQASATAITKSDKRRTGLLNQPPSASRSAHITTTAAKKAGSTGEVTKVSTKKRIPVTH